MDIQLDILNEQEAAILRETIAASQHIVICAHKSPDGDAIGSSLGWAYFCALWVRSLSSVCLI